jgi:hypothetical protein
MLLRNYFDRSVLWRVARRSFLHRIPNDQPCDRVLEFLPGACVAAMN